MGFFQTLYTPVLHLQYATVQQKMRLMKCVFGLFLLNVSVATWSLAAALPAGVDGDDAKPLTSKINAVTVYADRARVTWGPSQSR